LHTAAASAVRTAVKTKLSHRNHTIIGFFFEANKNKSNAKVALASFNSQLENSEFEEKQHICFKLLILPNLATLDANCERVTMPDASEPFWRQVESLETGNVSFFTFYNLARF